MYPCGDRGCCGPVGVCVCAPRPSSRRRVPGLRGVGAGPEAAGEGQAAALSSCLVASPRPGRGRQRLAEGRGRWR